MKALIEDRKSQEAQYEDERRQLALQASETLMREQMEVMRKLVEDSRKATETRTPSDQERAGREGEAKLVTLSEQDDIEAYLTTLKRVMRVYEIKEERWTVKIAPYLMGKAQLAYAAMKAEDTDSYSCLKEAILYAVTTSLKKRTGGDFEKQ